MTNPRAFEDHLCMLIFARVLIKVCARTASYVGGGMLLCVSPSLFSLNHVLLS